jgi:hypothetical protein
MVIDSTAQHARDTDAAANRAAVLAVVARLELDVRDARAAAHRARVETFAHRARLDRIHREAARAVGATDDAVAQLVLGSLAVLAAPADVT